MKILILCMLFGFVTKTYSQEEVTEAKSVHAVQTQGMNIDTLFISIPDHLLFGVEKDQRILLTIEADDTTKVIVENEFGGEVERTAMSRDFISINTSDAGSLQMKLLPLVNKSQIICVVKTVCGQMCDSQISFYTDRWEPIGTADVFPDFTLDTYIREGVDKNSQGYKNALATLNLYPVHMIMSADNTDMSIALEVKKYLSSEDYKLVSPYFTDEAKTLRWNKSSYK